MAKKNFAPWALTLMLGMGLLVVSCAEETSETASPEPVIVLTPVDATPPKYESVATRPANSQTNVLIGTSLSFQFNEPVQTSTVLTVNSTVCGGTVQLSSNNFLSCVPLQTPVASSDNQTFSVRPTSALSYNTTYQLRLTSGIADLAGNTLVATEVISVFTTAMDTSVTLADSLLSEIRAKLRVAAGYAIARTGRNTERTLPLTRDQIDAILNAMEQQLISTGLESSTNVPQLLETLLAGAIQGLNNIGITSATTRKISLSSITTSLATTSAANELSDKQAFLTGLLRTGINQVSLSGATTDAIPEAIAGLTEGTIAALSQLNIVHTTRNATYLPLLLETAIETTNTAYATAGYTFWEEMTYELGLVVVSGMSSWNDWAGLEPSWDDYIGTGADEIMGRLGEISGIVPSQAESLMGSTVEGVWTGWTGLSPSQSTTTPAIATKLGETTVRNAKTVTIGGQALNLERAALQVKQATTTVLSGYGTVASTALQQLETGILDTAKTYTDVAIDDLTLALSGSVTISSIQGDVLYNVQLDSVTNKPQPSFTFDSKVVGTVTDNCSNQTLEIQQLNNTFTFGILSDGDYGCALTITDYLGMNKTESLPTFTVDTIRPVLDNLSIAGGASTTTSQTVPVTLGARDDRSGLGSYYLSVDPTLPANPVWIAPFPPNGNTSHTFQSTTTGTKTLYAWVRDRAGNVSNDNRTASISLVDMTDPTINSFVLADNASYYNSNVVPVTIDGTDNYAVTHYLLKESSTDPAPSDAGWQTFTANPSYSFDTVGLRGEKTLYLWLKDASQNISPRADDSIKFDTEAPTDAAITIYALDNTTTTTSSRNVLLGITAKDNSTPDFESGINAYYVSESSTTPAVNSSLWKTIDPPAASLDYDTDEGDRIPFVLSEGVGTKTVYVWFKDQAGNISIAAKDDIESSYVQDLGGVISSFEQSLLTKIEGSLRFYEHLDNGSAYLLSTLQDNQTYDRIAELLNSIMYRINDTYRNRSDAGQGANIDLNNVTLQFQGEKNRSYSFTGISGFSNPTSDGMNFTANIDGADNETTGEAGTATIKIGDAEIGKEITIARIDNGIVLDTTKQTITLVDEFEPHVALQHNNYSGQDTDNGSDNSSLSKVLVEFEDTSYNDVLSEKERMAYLYYYPKFNLSASLYDKSGLRILSDNDSNYSNAVESEDFQDNLTTIQQEDPRLYYAVQTPLLAINSDSGQFAAINQKGLTSTGRDDAFYTEADYNAWKGNSVSTTVKIEMTEPVNPPSNLDTFKATPGALGQNNIPSGELLTNITAITAPTGKDHLQITLEDWRTIDASQHFTDRSQTVVANTEYEGISKESLLQIVGLTDLAGNAATAGNARGVVFVDATPPLATSAIVRDTGDSVVLTIVFDQLVRGTDNFTLQGSGVTYTFNNNTVTRSSTESGSVFDNTTNTNTASYNVSGQGTSTLTITIPDSGTSDFSNFFSALSHESTGSTNGTPGNTPSFYLAYDNITDLNYNSWSKVEFFDSYLVDNNGNPITPKLIGTDQLLPKIQAASVNDNASQTFLMEVTDHGLSIVSAFGTGAYDGSDLKGVGLIYSAGTTADGTDVNNATDNATTAINRDYPLYRFWNAADASESLDNQSNNNNTPVRAVIRFSEGTALSGSGSAYIRAILDSGDNATVDNASTETALLRKSIGLTSDANAGTTDAGDFSVKDNYLVVGIPDYTSGSGAGNPDKSSVDTDDVLVIDGVISGGVEYVLHISPPAVASADSGTTLSESNNPDLQVFRKVHLDVDLAALKAEYKTSDTDLLSGQNMSFQFLENINSVSGITYTAPTTINNSDPSFKVLGMNSSAESAINETASFTLKSSELSGSGLDNIVGDGATLAFTATDFSGNANTYTIAFKLGHNQTDNQTNINDLEGSHIVPILNEISSTANSGKRRLQAP